MCVECPGLPSKRIDHHWMTMADTRNVVVAIEIAVSIGIVQPYTLTPDEMYRVVVEQRIAWPKRPLPTF